eukprot:2155691-Prymnesium_polylepis.2
MLHTCTALSNGVLPVTEPCTDRDARAELDCDSVSTHDRTAVSKKRPRRPSAALRWLAFRVQSCRCARRCAVTHSPIVPHRTTFAQDCYRSSHATQADYLVLR